MRTSSKNAVEPEPVSSAKRAKDCGMFLFIHVHQYRKRVTLPENLTLTIEKNKTNPSMQENDSQNVQ